MYRPSVIRQHELQRAARALLATGFVLGTLRVFVLIPLFGETAAVLLELPVILGIAQLTCRRLVTTFDVAPELTSRLIMGGLAFLTLMGAELSLSILVFGRSFTGYLDQYHQLPLLLGLGRTGHSDRFC